MTEVFQGESYDIYEDTSKRSRRLWARDSPVVLQKRIAIVEGTGQNIPDGDVDFYQRCTEINYNR